MSAANDCAVLAVETLQRLRSAGVRGRILAYVANGDDMAHAVTIFESASCSGLFVYDEDGARHLPAASMAWSPTAIARAAFGDVQAARWVGGSRLPLRGPNRRLSPAEIRGGSLFTI